MFLLCLYHGLRVNEACQLAVPDIKQDESIWYLDLNEEKVNGQARRLKTASSKRRVPIHSKLLELGLIHFVEERRAINPSDFLFGELRTSKTGSRANAITRWFPKFRDQVLGPQPLARGDKGLHSLRHSFKDALRSANVSPEIQNALGGWTENRYKNSGDQYGQGPDLIVLKGAIDKVKY